MSESPRQQGPSAEHERFEEGEEAAPPGVRAMAIVRWLLVLAMAIAAGASLLYVYGSIGSAEENEGSVQYYCPMHPSVVQDHPGECPICGMTLVLRETHKGQGGKAPPTPPAPTTQRQHSGHRHDPSDPYYCPMHPEETGKDESARCPMCSMKLEKKSPNAISESPAQGAPSKEGHVAHRHEASDPYYCPMHPEETGQDASARCPLCSMKLEPKPEPEKKPAQAPTSGRAARKAAPLPSGKEETATPPAAESADDVPPSVPGIVPVEITSDRIQLIGMRTAQVKRASLASELRAVGYVTANESGLAVIQTRFSGWIQELHVSETGEPVKRGQLLARVYSPELLAAQQELLNARQWATQAGTAAQAGGEAQPSLVENARSRLLRMGMHPDELAEIERSGTPHELIEVRSPVRGYVVQKNALQGLYIQPGARLFDIADLSRVWVIVEVFERDAGRIRVGQPAILRLGAYPNEVFKGKVQLLYPAVRTDTRTIAARLEFANSDLRLRPGMFGDVALEATASEAVVVPREAVVDTGEHRYVFVVEAGGRFSPRPIRLGAQSDDDHVQVLAGLSEGETVVTTGNFLIDSESRLRATIEGPAQKTPDSSASECEQLFDRGRFPDKYAQCRGCEAQHRGMGSMEEDCRNAIPKPWR